MVDEREYALDEGKGLGDFFRALKRRRRLGLIVAALVFVAGAVATFAWPTMYASQAVILIEEPEVPRELVQTTVTTFAAQQIQLITQRVMTQSNLAEIIEKFDLYADKRRYLPTLLLTEDVEQQIQMDLVNVELTDPTSGRPTIDTIAFTVGFEHENPKTAQNVANELVSLYLEENVRARTVQTAETSQFLTTEVERLDNEVRTLEEQVARFKEENKMSLPEVNALNMQLIQRTEDELLNIDRELQSIEETRILIDAQLAQVKPTSPSILPDGRAVVSPEDQLKALQTQLAVLEGRYSANHPDVVRTRRELEALRTQTGITADLGETGPALSDARSELAKARENYSPDHPEVKRLEREVASLEARALQVRDNFDAMVKPDNPAYIQLSAQREQLVAEERALEAERRELKQRLEQFEERLLKAPAVEQQLVALERQLGTATQRYVAMRDRQFGAQMGQALESQSKGERFVLVEPPNMPLQPSSPNRPALLLLLLVLAPALGVGAIQLRESTDDSIWAAKDVESVLGMPPIAEVPIIMTAADKLRQRYVRLATWVAPAVTVALAAVIVHFAVRPLDVLWYSVVRQLGL